MKSNPKTKATAFKAVLDSPIKLDPVHSMAWQWFVAGWEASRGRKSKPKWQPDKVEVKLVERRKEIRTKIAGLST